jgi:hypothetical protein
MINDPVARVWYTLNETDKVAHKQSMHVPENPSSVAETTPLRTPPANPDAPHPQNTTGKLGNQVMEGLAVEGTRRTTTWPAGSRNNDRPITGVTETWISPELHAVVLFKQSDPVSGETTRKLTNISRAEPDASLFQPPPGYTIVEDQSTGSARAMHAPGGATFVLPLEPTRDSPPARQPQAAPAVPPAPASASYAIEPAAQAAAPVDSAPPAEAPANAAYVTPVYVGVAVVNESNAPVSVSKVTAVPPAAAKPAPPKPPKPKIPEKPAS